ncbi:MAG: twin-arginine translocase TatA/TatE family subunit [Actinomycetota bacterium]|nr:twin-arginine translocase TatA/TatE family subunit [Actinomycetota bacterium]
MPSIGPMELIIVLAVVLLFLGPRKLPDVGRSLGQGMREFKGAVTGDKRHEDLTTTAAPDPARDAPVGSEAAER